MTAASLVAPPALAVGQTLAPGYRVLAHLRRGRDTDVYEVWSDERACRCVAKVIRPDREDDPKPRRRLLREGRLLRRLAHLHLARAYAVYANPPALVLEVLTGQTLERRIQQLGRLPVDEVICLGSQLGSVVHYLHWQGWLHLDLKPSNIVCERGLAKVLDLSIARGPGRARAGVGTRPYMAPEQARGGRLSWATDVWGLGTVMFEATLGRPPFPIRADGPRYPQLESRAAPVAAIRRRLPRALAGLIDTSLDPDPAGRPSLAEVMATLNALSA